MDLAAAVAALGTFRGVARRFEVRGEAAGVVLVDSYDHLPTEVAAALAAARAGRWGRVVCCFQPHRFSRTDNLGASFADAFGDADVLAVTGIYAAGEEPRPGVTGKRVVDAVLDAHPWKRVAWLPTLDDVVAYLGATLRPGDLCLTLGAGDLTTVPDRLLALLEARERSSASAAIEAAAAILGARAQRDVPLGPRTTYRVGGAASLFVTLEAEADVAAVAEAVRTTGVDVVVVGKGSNLLVADAGFPGLAITLGEAFTAVEVSDTTVRAGGAAALPVVARRTVAAGLTGFEWAVGVPGSVGGAVRMNAGGHGSDLAASLLRVRVVDLRTGEDGVVSATTLQLGYRSSSVAPHQLIVWAELGLTPGDGERGAGGAGRDRRLASGSPAGRPERGVGVHEPARRLGGAAHRRGGRQGAAPWHGRGVHEARQLHPGGRGRFGRRRARADDRGAGARARPCRSDPPPGDPLRRLSGRLGQPSTTDRGLAGVSTTTIDPRIRARRIEVQRTVGRRRLQRVVDLGVVAAVALGFAGALRSPLLDVDDVRVSGTERTSAQEALERSGLQVGDQLMDVDLRAAGTGVATLPWVDDVQLHRGLDGVVDIVITERVAIVVVGEGDAGLLVDVEGVVLAPAAADPALAAGLVRISDAPSGMRPGEALGLGSEAALRVAARLATAAPGAVATVSVGDEVTATLVAGGTVRFGDAGLLEAKVRSLRTMLDRVDLSCLAEIDLRLPGSPVLTREEACS